MAFACSHPPLVMTYDFVIGLHSVWHVTKAKAEVSIYVDDISRQQEDLSRKINVAKYSNMTFQRLYVIVVE